MRRSQKLLHKITKIPQSVVAAPASNVRFDAHSLLQDADTDWRRTWAHGCGIVDSGTCTVALVPHGTITADDVITAGKSFKIHTSAVDGASPRRLGC